MPTLRFFLTCCLLALSTLLNASENQRIISTNAGATELIFALQADAQLIAIDVTSQLPNDYRAVANIGYHRNLSAEGLMSLHPSIVIGGEHMGPRPALKVLQQAHINVLQLATASNVMQLRDNISQVAKALNAQGKAEQLLISISSQLDQLRNNNLSGARVAFLLSMDPSKLRLAGDDTGGDALIRLMGGTNVAKFKNYRNVSAEALLAMQADIILVADRDKNLTISTLLSANPSLVHLASAKNQTIVAVDSKVIIAGLSIAAIDEALSLLQQIKPSLAKQ